MGGKLTGLPGSKGGDGGIKSTRWPVSSDMPQGLAVGPVKFNTLINDPDEGLDSTFGVSAHDTKLRVTLSMLEDRATIQTEQAGEID